jgi:molybdenum-dependent DNA-binding transcriptional regulator ModE
MRDLNYNHLRYFWAVAHEGSLTRAAEHMNLSQSALSVQIQKLEHQVGHPLFERVGKKLVLTEAGQIALDYADTVFKAGEELMSTLRGQPLASRQVLRVGALTTLSRNFQLEFLRPLVGRSDVELIVRSGNIRDLLAQFAAQSPAQRTARQPGRPTADGQAEVPFPGGLAYRALAAAQPGQRYPRRVRPGSRIGRNQADYSRRSG